MPNPLYTSPAGATAEHPQWFMKLQQDLANRAAELTATKRAKGPYGITPAQEAEKLAALRAQPEYRRPGGITYEVQVLPGIDPIPFTPQELVNIVQDFDLARQVYARATGIRNPAEEDVQDFRMKIRHDFPNLEESGEESFRKQFAVFDSDMLSEPREAGEGAVAEVLSPLSDKAIMERYKTKLEGIIPHLIGRKTVSGYIDPILQALQEEREERSELLRSQQVERERHRQPTLAQIKEHFLTDKYITAHYGGQMAADSTLTVPIIRKKLKVGMQEAESYIDTQIRTNQPIDMSELPRVVPSAAIFTPDIIGSYFEPAISSYLEKVRTHEGSLEGPLPPAQRQALLRRVGVVEEADRLKKQSETLAPFNIHHSEAEDILRRSAAMTQRRTALTGRQLEELRELDVKPEVYRELGEQAPALQHVTPEGIEKYYSPRAEPIIAHMRQAAEEEWQKRIAPRISGSFAVMGATHGGAHGQALTEARDKHFRDLEQRIIHYQDHAYDKAREAAQAAATLQHSQGLERAQVKGRLGEHQQDHLVRVQELALRDALRAKTHEQADLTAMSQLAQQRQAQRQREIDSRIQATEREDELAERGLALEANLARGFQIPLSVTPNVSRVVSAPPSGPGFMSALLGQLGALGSIPGMPGAGQYAGMAKGGHAKGQKFAGGGLIPSWQELAMQVQPDKYAQQQEQIANRLQSYQSPFNPMANWMGHVSAQQLMNLRGDPLEAMGKGMALAQADREASQQHAYDRSRADQVSAANLYDKMNESLRHQQHFLADYEAKRAHHMETQRHHSVIEEHSARKIGMPSKSALKQIDKTTEKAKANYEKALKEKSQLEKESEVFKRVNQGNLSRYLPSWMTGEDPADVEAADAITKGTKKRIPLSRSRSKEANEQILKMQTEPFEEQAELALEALRNAGHSEEAVEAYKAMMEKQFKSPVKPTVAKNATIAPKAVSTALSARKAALLQERQAILGG